MPPPRQVAPKWSVTPWGSLVRRHTVLTPLKFWTDLSAEVEYLADQDIDWTVAVQERIDGLREYLRRRIDDGAPEYWRD